MNGPLALDFSANGAVLSQPETTRPDIWCRTGLWPWIFWALFQAGINRAFGPKITAMPQSLSLVIVHVIFSTKERRPFLDSDTRPKLHAYLATVARNAGCEAYRVGGMADHAHLAI